MSSFTKSLTVKIDKYGRKVKDQQQSNLKKYYRLESETESIPFPSKRDSSSPESDPGSGSDSDFDSKEKIQKDSNVLRDSSLEDEEQEEEYDDEEDEEDFVSDQPGKGYDPARGRGLIQEGSEELDTDDMTDVSSEGSLDDEDTLGGEDEFWIYDEVGH